MKIKINKFSWEIRVGRNLYASTLMPFAITNGDTEMVGKIIGKQITKTLDSLIGKNK